MNIKPNKASTRDYRKGYLMGGQIDQEGVSGGTANLPGGYMQTGGAGVYDPEHPERGAQGWSTFYKPAEVPATEGAIGEMGHTALIHDENASRKFFKYKP